VAVNTDISVLGINEAIRSLNKIEPGLRKEFNNEARAIGAPAVNAVRDAYRFVPLSGMNRKWAGPAVNGRKVFPWNLDKAKKGVDVVFDTNRRTTGTINIVQRDTATAIFETAGRKTSNPLGNALGSLQPGRTRIIGPVVYSRIAETTRVMGEFALRVVDRVNREMK
jgi:hypothetical protein